jgi:hypothetical protein
VLIRTSQKGECDGGGVMHKGGVGARRNTTAVGGVTRDDGRSVVCALLWGFKSRGAVWPMWTSGGS